MSRISEALTQIKSLIMEFNPYFDNAYIATSVNVSDGGQVADKDTVLFPCDHLGNYFYLKPSGQTNWIASGRVEEHKASFVAYVENMDAEQIIDNICAAIVAKCRLSLSIKPRFATTNISDIIKSETPKKGQQTALKNIGENASLIKIDFVVLLPKVDRAKSEDCIINPCSNC